MTCLKKWPNNDKFIVTSEYNTVLLGLQWKGVFRARVRKLFQESVVVKLILNITVEHWQLRFFEVWSKSSYADTSENVISLKD